MGLIHTIRKIFQRSSAKEEHSNKQQKTSANPIQTNLQENIQQIKTRVGNSSDVSIREIRIGKGGSIAAAVIFTDGLADTKSVNDFVMDTLLLKLKQTDFDAKLTSGQTALHILEQHVVAVSSLKRGSDLDELLTAVLSGDTVVLVDGADQYLILSLRGWEDRGVTEPSSQTVIRGPKDGFSENLRANTALVRRRIKDPNLWLETYSIGTVTKTDVAIMYIHGIVTDGIVEEVRARLKRIKIDGILESGYIEELIQDESYTPFPTIFNTERPDVVAASLLEGRVAILVDGTPFVLIVPATFGQFFQAAEDYYQRADIGNLLRLLRYLAFFIALLGPSLYIAITTYHQEMLPTLLLVTLAAQREGVPFPAFVEAVLMEMAFEILREAGVRMPRAVGQAVSIVGALVVGQAAVEAGIVSAAMVIVVAITAISSFVAPSFNMAISVRILRFLIMALAASFGLFGITIALIAMVLHLCSLRSFGIPYMAPFAPFIGADQKDSILRVPWWGMFARPRLISQKNIRREQNSPTPKPDPRHREGR